MSEYLRSSGVALCSENGDMHAIFYLIKPRHWIILFVLSHSLAMRKCGYSFWEYLVSIQILNWFDFHKVWISLSIYPFVGVLDVDYRHILIFRMDLFGTVWNLGYAILYTQAISYVCHHLIPQYLLFQRPVAAKRNNRSRSISLTSL